MLEEDSFIHPSSSSTPRARTVRGRSISFSIDDSRQSTPEQSTDTSTSIEGKYVLHLSGIV